MASGVRKIRNGAPNRIISAVHSRKMSGSTPAESRLERHGIVLLEVDPVVSSIEAQPLTLEYWVDGKCRKYTPDLRVRRDDLSHPLLLEIKPKCNADKPKYKELFRVVTPMFWNFGYLFDVMTDQFIYQEPRLTNAHFLRRYEDVPVTVEHQALCLDLFRVGQMMNVSDLRTVLRHHGIPECVSYALIYQTLFGVDLCAAPIDDRAQIWFRGAQERLRNHVWQPPRISIED